MLKVINARGTTRNIEDTQLAEYERKGYKKVEDKKLTTSNPKKDK